MNQDVFLVTSRTNHMFKGQETEFPHINSNEINKNDSSNKNQSEALNFVSNHATE